MADRDIVKGLGYRKRGASFDVDKLTDAIRAGYEANARPDALLEKTTFSPSALGYESGTCARRWVLAFGGKHIAVNTADASGFAVMQSGTDAHARIQKAMTDAGIMVEQEKEVRLEDPPVRGFVDCIVEIDGEELVGEIKTTRQEAWMWRESSMKGANYHMYQILLYMHILEKKKGFLLYENRNDNSLLVIPVAMDEKNTEVLGEALDWMRKVKKASDEKQLPQRPWTKRNKICRNCPLFDECWNPKMPMHDVVIPPMEVHKF